MRSANRKPRVRTIFLLVNLVVLLIPLGGLGVLRIYETELIRRTEAELISQGALLQSFYADALMTALRDTCERPDNAPAYGLAVELEKPLNPDERFQPVAAELEMRSAQILPPPPLAQTSKTSPDPCALKVGKSLEPILLEAQKTTLSGVYLLDIKGNIVATTQTIDGGSLAHWVEIQRALRGESVHLLRWRESADSTEGLNSIQRRGQVRVYMAMPVVGDGRVIGAILLVRTPESLSQALYKNRLIFGGFLLIIALAMVLISLLTSWRITRPIKKLIAQTRRVAGASSEVATELERPGTHEVSELSHAFAQMTRTLQTRSDYVHTFAQSVSHELKTPLTSMKGAIELLEDHLPTMPQAERDELIAMLRADTERMNNLVARLLILARADTLDARDEVIELGPCFEKIAARYDDSLKIEVIDAEDILGATRLAISEQAFASVITNLFDNAQHHGAKAIRVIVTKGTEDTKSIELIVSDDGRGISPGNAARVFDSFFTTRRATGGTGLGLSITRSLLRAYGAEIKLLRSQEDNIILDGASFWLRFKHI